MQVLESRREENNRLKQNVIRLLFFFPLIVLLTAVRSLRESFRDIALVRASSCHSAEARS